MHYIGQPAPIEGPLLLLQYYTRSHRILRNFQRILLRETLLYPTVLLDFTARDMSFRSVLCVPPLRDFPVFVAAARMLPTAPPPSLGPLFAVFRSSQPNTQEPEAMRRLCEALVMGRCFGLSVTPVCYVRPAAVY